MAFPEYLRPKVFFLFLDYSLLDWLLSNALFLSYSLLQS